MKKTCKHNKLISEKYWAVNRIESKFEVSSIILYYENCYGIIKEIKINNL